MNPSDARARDTHDPEPAPLSVIAGGRPSKIGPYEITGELGRGGMGVVYHARDSRLNRSVALKAVSESFVDDPERLARFEREGRLLGALDHPNVAGIHGIEEVGGQRYLVLQYVDGETLAERILRGPMPVDDALDVCRQVALALETAHDNGVIHRDLKPANIKVKPDGQVKVLDFGLAKETLRVPSGDPADSPTLAATMAGVIVGTAAYMSPEQARGRAIDRRADIWSFGCVLYECLCGRQAFGGETVSDSLAAVLEREPDWTALPAAVPQRARQLLRRLLVKDPRRRIRDMGDVRLELEDMIERPAGASSDHARAAGGGRARRPWLVAGVVAAVLAVGAFVAGRAFDRGRDGGVTRLSIALPSDVRVMGAWILADGRHVLFPGRPLAGLPGLAGEEPLARVYVRDLSNYELRAIPGTEGLRGPLAPARDGKSLLFVGQSSSASTQSRLLSVPLDAGSPPTAIADWQDSWSGLAQLGNGDIVTLAAMGTALVRLPAGAAGTPVRMKIDSGDYRGMFEIASQASAVGDHHLLVNAISYGPRGWVVGVALLDCATGKARTLVGDGGNATLLPGGRLLFSRGDALLAARFDTRRLALVGEPVSVMSGMRTHGIFLPSEFTIAHDGTLVFARGGRVGEQRQMVAITGTTTRPLTTDHKIFTGVVAVSSTGRLAVCATGPRALDEIWVWDAGQSAMRLAVSLPADCSRPVWSPDGHRLAFTRTANDSTNGVYVVGVDSGEPPHRLVGWEANGAPIFPSSWSPDGRAIIATRHSTSGPDIVVLPLAADGTCTAPRELVATPARETDPTLSRDGRWLAYTSDVSGRDAVYVRAFGAGGTFGPAYQVTSGRAMYPRWTGDDRIVYYDELRACAMIVPLELDGAVSAGEPSLYVDNTAQRIMGFGVRGDGTAIGIQASEAEMDQSRYDVVLHGADEVARQLASH